MSKRLIQADMRDAERLSDDLDKLAHKAVPHAARNALNRIAFAGRKMWQGEMKRTFELRNQWTTRSVQVERARGLNVRTMVAVLGSTEDYVRKQEDGFQPQPAIPTAAAANQEGTKRTKPVRANNRLRRLGRAKRPQGGSRKERNAAAIAGALKKGGKRIIFLDMGGRKGLFRLKGSKKSFKLKMLWDTSNRSKAARPRPTLARTMHRMDAGPADKILRGAFLEQLKRHGPKVTSG